MTGQPLHPSPVIELKEGGPTTETFPRLPASSLLSDIRSFRSEKLQDKSSPNFSNVCPGFCPEFGSEFSPIFSRIFRASFCGKRRPERIHQKSPPFFNAKFPGGNEKIFTTVFWRAGKVTFFPLPPMEKMSREERAWAIAVRRGLC